MESENEKKTEQIHRKFYRAERKVPISMRHFLFKIYELIDTYTQNNFPWKKYQNEGKAREYLLPNGINARKSGSINKIYRHIFMCFGMDTGIGMRTAWKVERILYSINQIKKIQCTPHTWYSID